MCYLVFVNYAPSFAYMVMSCSNFAQERPLILLSVLH